MEPTYLISGDPRPLTKRYLLLASNAERIGCSTIHMYTQTASMCAFVLGNATESGRHRVRILLALLLDTHSIEGKPLSRKGEFAVEGEVMRPPAIGRTKYDH